ncbi:MAG: site-2 protease family protein [Verrucomicrobia bacterium]|nr:site-2 protease family protein [Verrucomicrobiota bacterium]
MLTLPGRIPISIHPLFWFVSFLIGWLWTNSVANALICIFIILFSVLFHELGHAITALVFQQKARIELAAFGGFTYRQGRKLKLWEEFLVVLNGPLAGLLLSLAAYILLHFLSVQNPVALFVLRFTFVANLFWTIINLLPVLPLDGGHLLSIILESIFGFKGIKIALVASLVISIVVSILFFAVGMLLAGALFLMFTFESFRSLRYYKIFNEQDREPELQQLLKEANLDAQEGHGKLAIEKLEQVRSKAGKGILYTMACSQLAQIYYEAGRDQDAYELLKPNQSYLNSEQLALFHRLAYRNKDYKKVASISAQCFQDSPSYKTALINAYAFAALGQAEPSVGWLECAMREGLPSAHKVLEEPIFDTIRHEALFQKIQKK